MALLFCHISSGNPYLTENTPMLPLYVYSKREGK